MGRDKRGIAPTVRGVCEEDEEPGKKTCQKCSSTTGKKNAKLPLQWLKKINKHCTHLLQFISLVRQHIIVAEYYSVNNFRIHFVRTRE